MQSFGPKDHLTEIQCLPNLYQKPDEALQTYNTRYSAYFGLAYPEFNLDDPMTKMHCTHYTTSLYGKLGDELTGRFYHEI